MKKEFGILLIGIIIFCNFLIADTKKTNRVPMLKGIPRIDGVMNEKVWNSALKLELQYETTPGENIPASVKTEIYIYNDVKNIYFGIKCFDPDPSKIRYRYSERDKLGFEDIININIDTFNDERRNYFFGCNPLGIQRDGIETRMVDMAWDAIWDSVGEITEYGYCLEIAIPFSNIQFHRKNGLKIWGLDISRWYPRAFNRRLGLVKIDRNNNSYQSQFLKITGFDGVKPGKSIELIPTLTGASSQQRVDMPDGDFSSLARSLAPGFSAKWGITSNLNINATVNPDFSQVEADSRQLDVNQPFALFFQEKRPFFTEGMDFFRSPLNVIYTRTLRDPQWGLKISGKQGDSTIGGYYVRDDLTNLIFPGSQYSRQTSLNDPSDGLVLRYKHDIGTKLTVGGLITNRSGSNYYNRVFGFDGTARITNRHRVEFQYLGSSTEYPYELADEYSQPLDVLNDGALKFEYVYQSRGLNANIQYLNIGQNFRADLGFVPRVDYWKVDGGIRYNWYNNDSWWSQLGLGYRFIRSKDGLGNDLYNANEIDFSFQGVLQSNANIFLSSLEEFYNGQNFKQWVSGGFAFFQPTSKLQAMVMYMIGDKVDYANTRPGTQFQLRGQLTYHLGTKIQIHLDHNYEKMRVNQQDLFDAHITQGFFVYHLNARLFFRCILQHINYNYNVENYTFERDPEFRHLFSQLLLSYKFNPRTVVFLGYSDNYLGNQLFNLTQSDRTVFMKISYSWQL